MKAALFSADAVKHVTNNLERSLSDVVTSLRHCERQVVAATDDTTMRESTENRLVEIARLLSVIGRLVEWECGELGKLASWADEAAQRRAANT